MATFDATLRQIIGVKAQYADGFKLDHAVNGVPSGRDFFDGTKLDLNQPFIVSDAEWDTIWTFWQTNGSTSFTFGWDADAASYTMRFIAPPRQVRGGLTPGYSFAFLNLGEV